MGLLFAWKKWYVYIASCMKTGVTTVFVNNFYLSPHVIVFLARSHKMNYPKIEHKLRK